MNLLEGMGKVPTAALVVSAGACMAVGGILGGLMVKKISADASSTDKLPEKWVKVGKIKDLIIYPVKSMVGIPVNEAVLGRLGLHGIDSPHFRDRVFVVTDATGKCQSQKQIPALALFHPKIEGDHLHLTFSKDPSSDITVDIPVEGSQAAEKVATIFGEKVKALDCGDKVAAWLSTLTGKAGLRLVYHASLEPQRKSIPSNAKFHTYRESHTGTFHDETSYMIMSEESVAAVNKELAEPVSQRNFRATIIVDELPEPFSEDFWGYIRIGNSGSGPVLKTSAPCRRCKLVIVDQDNGTFRTDEEPLKTLYKLKRPVGDKEVTKLISKAAILGAHFGVFEGEGDIIRVGETVYAALV